jgi:hypothetical protein
MGRKAKAVKADKNVSRGGASQKSADSLPKILRLAGLGGSLQAQRVKCGKANCRCARGQLHGGYYYLFLSTPAGVSKFYIRRRDVPAVHAIIAERHRRSRAWRAELNEARAFLRRMMSAAVGVKR